MTKTTNYQLNQWAKSDRVMMDDFNADNAKIDAALKANADTAAALQTALANAGNCSIAISSYTGNGKHGSANPTVINFSKKPTLFIARGKTAILFGTSADSNNNTVVWNYVNGVSVDSIPLVWNGTNASFYSVSSNFAAREQLNAESEVYQVIALLDAEN